MYIGDKWICCTSVYMLWHRCKPKLPCYRVCRACKSSFLQRCQTPAKRAAHSTRPQRHAIPALHPRGSHTHLRVVPRCTSKNFLLLMSDVKPSIFTHSVVLLLSAPRHNQPAARTCESSPAVQMWALLWGAQASALTQAWWRVSSAMGSVGYLRR